MTLPDGTDLRTLARNGCIVEHDIADYDVHREGYSNNSLSCDGLETDECVELDTFSPRSVAFRPDCRETAVRFTGSWRENTELSSETHTVSRGDSTNSSSGYVHLNSRTQVAGKSKHGCDFISHANEGAAIHGNHTSSHRTSHDSVSIIEGEFRVFTICEDNSSSIEGCDENDCDGTPRYVTEIFKQDEDGDTKLHLSVIHKLDQISKEFIRCAPRSGWLDIPNNMLQTALHLAVITKQPEVVRDLILNGACLECHDERGNTPLHTACELNELECIQMLTTPLQSVEINRDNMFRFTCQQNIPQNMEIRNFNGKTCIHLAAEADSLDAVNLLLHSGADVNSADGKSGRTALHYAVENNNLPMVEYLMATRGVDINKRTYGSCSALEMALGRGHCHIAKTLYQNGAKFDEETTPDEDMYSDDD